MRALLKIIGGTGVNSSTDLLVSQHAGTPNMSVDIAIGDIFIAYLTYLYHGWTDAVNTVVITSNSSGNTRIDAVVAWEDLSVVSSSSNNNPGALKFTVVAGTPGVSPAAPSDSDIQSAIGAGNPFLRLANVTVATGSSSIISANISDQRAIVPLRSTPTTNPAFLARQSIINGNFDIWQRSTSIANPGNGTFVADRWLSNVTNNGTLPTTITHSRQLQTSGDVANSFYFYRIAPNGAGSGFGVSDLYKISQTIEFGTRYLAAASQKVTASFWAKSSIGSKKIGYSLTQNYGTGGSPSSAETITGGITTLTSSWQKITYTFTLNTLVGKTFGTNLDDYLQMNIFVMWGSTTGTNNGLGSAETFVGSGNIDIAQVQVCAGDTALPFQPKSFDQELQACQRYYSKSFKYTTVPAQNTSEYEGSAHCYNFNAARAGALVVFPVRMRTTPTVTTYSPGTTNTNWYDVDNGQSRAVATNTVCDRSILLNSVNFDATGNRENRIHWTAEAEL